MGDDDEEEEESSNPDTTTSPLLLILALSGRKRERMGSPQYALMRSKGKKERKKERKTERKKERKTERQKEAYLNLILLSSFPPSPCSSWKDWNVIRMPGST